MDGLDLVFEGADAMLVHLETQEVKGGSPQDTLLQIDS